MIGKRIAGALYAVALLTAGGIACTRAPSPLATTQGARRVGGDRAAKVLTGKAALGDWTTDSPGVRRRITPTDMPRPYDTPSVDNGPAMVPRPEGAWPKVPQGFRVEEFASGLTNPRVIVTAPNGDLFVAESEANRVRVLRDADGDGKPEKMEVFAEGLAKPFGIAFYPLGSSPRYVYVANTDSVVRFPYRNGDLKASGSPETIVSDIPGGGRLRGGGHWTRDLVFSRDGGGAGDVRLRRLSHQRLGGAERARGGRRSAPGRADILSYNPDGTGYRLYAWGIRNARGATVASASPSILRPATCGPRSTSGMVSATTSCRITSPE